MNFLKMFGASMLAWIVGIVGIFVFAIGSLLSALLSMNMNEMGIKEESVLYINIGSQSAPMARSGASATAQAR